MKEAARAPAEVYDSLFVPALFAPWAPVVLKMAGVRPGQRVLDVGCGTGALACSAAEAAVAVVGLDPNPDMLAVARRKPSAVEWTSGRAEALPFAYATFDAVVSQFAMMFFEDRVKALREMWRVLVPGGRLAVAVCAGLESIARVRGARGATPSTVRREGRRRVPRPLRPR